MRAFSALLVLAAIEQPFRAATVFGKTELGLADMVGNVWEWTADWYAPFAAATG